MWNGRRVVKGRIRAIARSMGLGGKDGGGGCGIGRGEVCERDKAAQRGRGRWKAWWSS
jgi:hypothetical protein